MFRNYLKIALRNLSKNRSYTAINICGFAVGLACCLLIGLYVQNELSYDRFHKHADRVHRMILDSVILDHELESPLTPSPMAGVLVRDFPEVEHATRIRGSEIFGSEGVSIEYAGKRFTENRFFFADSALFSVFSFEVLEGDPSTMLLEPNSVVLTRRMVEKYFGEEPAIGRALTVNGEVDYQVTGIIEDVPTTSHWQFDFLGSLSSLPIEQNVDWFNNSLLTYFVAAPGADMQALENKLKPFVNEQIAPQLKGLLGVDIDAFHLNGGKLEYYAQPLTDIHLYSNLRGELGVNGDIRSVYTFSAIALLILLIAASNFH